MGIFGPFSKADEAYYRARDREDRRRAEAAKKRQAQFPFRLEMLKRVKAGEITLDEAKRIIKRHEKAKRPAEPGEEESDED